MKFSGVGKGQLISKYSYLVVWKEKGTSMVCRLMSSSSHIRCVSNLEIVVELCLLFFSAVNYQSLF